MNMLRSRWLEGKMVCVGLDSQYSKIPDDFRALYPINMAGARDAVFQFNRQIICNTGMLVCAYKPNIAFYSYMDFELLRALLDTCLYIRETWPGVPIILDAKRGDIGNTNDGYVVEAFQQFEADAVTVSPYMGGAETYKPFLDQKDKGIIVLCRTSNPDAADFQDELMVAKDSKLDWLRQHKIDPEELGWKKVHLGLWLAPQYQLRAIDVAMNWNYNGNCGLVVGATAPEPLQYVRQLVGKDMPILVPGIGAQGGDLEKTLKAGCNDDGSGLIINASRSVIFAPQQKDSPYKGKDNFTAACAEVERMNTIITNYRQNRKENV
jgi:orotidine-5'-phosphate decarboxylase